MGFKKEPNYWFHIDLKIVYVSIFFLNFSAPAPSLPLPQSNLNNQLSSKSRIAGTSSQIRAGTSTSQLSTTPNVIYTQGPDMNVAPINAPTREKVTFGLGSGAGMKRKGGSDAVGDNGDAKRMKG